MNSEIQKSIENRKSAREALRIPVKLEASNSAANIFLGYTVNISKSGLSMHVSPEVEFPKDSEVTVFLEDQNPFVSTQVQARLVWSSHSQIGLQFVKEYESIRELLQRSVIGPQIVCPAKVHRFYPYINGQDVDTKKYEYFPYADKFLTSYRKVQEYRILLRKGQMPADVSTYIYAQYAIADRDMNLAAVEAAHKAFQQFSIFSLERRRKILDDIRELLIQEKDNLIELMKIEGHPRKLAEWEYSGMLTAHLKESLDYYQSQMFQIVGDNVDETLITIRRPEGVICVCPPKNASCSNSLTASFALLAGNTLVVKPPRNMPVATMYLWRNVVGRALNANGAPKGTINLVLGDSNQFMSDWLDDPRVRGILMFNDSIKGLEIGRKIYEKGKKPILELSGNDHMIIWKDAPIEEAADSLLDCFMGSTQICMVPKKALIHSEIYEKFMTVFIRKVKALKFGLPSDPDTILSPVIKINDFFQHLEDGISNGAKLLTGGQRVNHLGEHASDGLYLEPTVLEVPLERANMMRCVKEENFFPLLPVVRVSGGGITSREKDENIFKEMMQLIKSNQYGLRISAWVRDQYYLKKFIDQIHYSGLLRINSKHIGFSPCLSTHGGINFSGGPFGEMNYVWQKSSHLQGIAIKKLPNDPNLKVVE